MIRALISVLAIACGRVAHEPEDPDAPRTRDTDERNDTSVGGNAGTSADEVGLDRVDKVDLLFMIDNSVSMSDKQDILRLAVPDLVSRLVNPMCVDAMGKPFPPAAAGAACATGQHREFNPIQDLHVGVISSSLGDAGANVSCPAEGFPRYLPDRVDLAHLVGSLPRSQTAGLHPEGFLEWSAGRTDIEGFNRNFQQMIADVGENGCGYEASLESWYRFLVDPFPYRQLVRVPCEGSSSMEPNCVQFATGADNRVLLDDTLLAQRRAFLRPDSLVAIVMLTDENDCSFQAQGQAWVVAAIDDIRPMFRGSSECTRDANAKCCYSCPSGPPDGCEADPICAADFQNDVLANRLPPALDGRNLRCFQQKRRFGIDLLYPTARYVNALKEPKLCTRALDLDPTRCSSDDLVENPLYTGGRTPSLVYLGAIVGVPWQSIASEVDAQGQPLAAGQLRYQSSEELASADTWSAILGSPGRSWQRAGPNGAEVTSIPALPPTVEQMIESELPRAGVALGNAINGREYDTGLGLGPGTPDDLEYACIFPLPVPRDCAQRDPAAGDACGCYAGNFDNPLCEQTPGSSPPGTTQYSSKAYPGLRHLEVLKGYGENSVVASICARNVVDASLPDYAYRPAVSAILERLQEHLALDVVP